MPMTFASPLVLGLLIVPVSVLAWLWTSNLRRAEVPAIALWQAIVGPGETTARVRRPPIWATLLIAASIAAILAAAEPSIGLAAREEARLPAIQWVKIRNGQAMVQLRGGSTLEHVDVMVSHDGTPVGTVSATVDVGKTRDLFIDVPDAVPLELTASIAGRSISDATIEPTRAGGHASALAGVPESVSRLVDVYNRHRPAGIDQPMIVALGDSMQSKASMNRNSPAVFIASELASTPPADAQPGSIEVISHEITAGIAWPAVLATARIAATQPDGGWLPLVHIADQAVVAIRTQPARQVWIGFASPDFERSPAFVVFWTNLLDWITHGQPAYAVQISPVGQLSALERGVARQALAPACFTISAVFCAMAAIAVTSASRS